MAAPPSYLRRRGRPSLTDQRREGSARSTPALVLPGELGHPCCYYAIRALMFAAAIEADVDPDRVSFVAALRITRRSLSLARDLPPRGTDRSWADALICRRLTILRGVSSCVLSSLSANSS